MRPKSEEVGMRRKRLTVEQRIAVLKQAEIGVPVAEEVIRKALVAMQSMAEGSIRIAAILLRHPITIRSGCSFLSKTKTRRSSRVVGDSHLTHAARALYRRVICIILTRKIPGQVESAYYDQASRSHHPHTNGWKHESRILQLQEIYWMSAGHNHRATADDG